MLCVLALTLPAATHAQPTIARGPSCLDSVPLSAMRRVPVYAPAEIADEDPVNATVVASVDVLTQALAEQARALLGAGPGQLPPGEPSVSWRQLDHQLFVVARRDGKLSWCVQPPVWLSDQSQGDSAARHLGRALDAAKRQGQAFLWDDSIKGDSLSWLIRLEPATLS